MLALRPGCECCDLDLPPDTPDARICTFECTFCAACADGVLGGGRCPNCGGNLVPRPIRPPAMLAKYPATKKRTVKPGGCASPETSQGRVPDPPLRTIRHAPVRTSGRSA